MDERRKRLVHKGLGQSAASQYGPEVYLAVSAPGSIELHKRRILAAHVLAEGFGRQVHDISQCRSHQQCHEEKSSEHSTNQ